MGNLKGKRVLLVGGAGFIGHHLALELVQQGADVFIVDSLQINNLLSFVSGDSAVPNKNLYISLINQRLQLLRELHVPMQVQDARDYHALSRVFNEINPHIVIQLAAVAHANVSNKDPFSTFDHSLRTLENALDCSRGKVEHFIYFSSSMVYGNFKTGYVTEETPCEPLGIYGALKYAGEKIVIAYNQVFDLPFTIVRPSALYGERCVSRRVGQLFIENAIKGLDINVNGDGTDRLDFTYIGDLVNGIMCVLNNEKSKGEIFNLTYGESRSMSDMAQLLRREFPDVNINYLPKDKLMPSRGTLSVEKAKALIGYQPQFPLEKGFIDYINWYKQMFSKVVSTNTQIVELPTDGGRL